MKGRCIHSLGYLLVACSVVTAVSGRTLECQHEGRFPHPQNCGNYVDCFRDADGLLVAREGHCQGYPFSAEKRRCVDYSEKPDCVTKGIRTSFHASDFNYLCEEDKSAAGCVNCKLAFSCINGNATISVCDDSTVCGDTLEAFGFSVCLPLGSFDPPECECKKVGLVTDPFTPVYYHYCSSISALPEIFSCEEGTEFNDVNNECESSGPPETPPCEKTGTFVNPYDCSWSYTCLPGGVVRSSSCADGEYYKDSACVPNCDAPVSGTENCGTLNLGFHPYESDCSKYLVCKDLVSDPKIESCPEGFFFSGVTRRCTETILPEGCQTQPEFDYSTCPGYKDLAC